VQRNNPPTWSGSAGVIVTVHSPAADRNSTGPVGPFTRSSSARSSLVDARLVNEAPESRSDWPPGSLHRRSIEPGGGAQASGCTRVGRLTCAVRSPVIEIDAPPVCSGPSGPGEAVALGVGEGAGVASGGGGETVTPPGAVPVDVQAMPSAARTAPTAHDPRIVVASVPHGPGRPGTYDAGMDHPSSSERPAGSLVAIGAAGVTLATAVVYVGLIVAQGSAELASAAVVTALLVALAACAVVGGLRRHPDRVIALGAATGGLIGAAVLSLFSIGVLLLVAGGLSLVAWVRAGVEASRRQQLLAALAGVLAAIGQLALLLFV
jgi:hypothetical protein